LEMNNKNRMLQSALACFTDENVHKNDRLLLNSKEKL
jgi:hypothetical protein